MVLPFQINGARAVIPGIYDSFRVQGSLPSPVPAGRSVLIMGESEEGIPGEDLDLRLNFFEDFQSVRDFYQDGPIVDAARQMFTTQPSPAFGGSVERLYVWKTNQTTRAEKTISSPSNFGSIAAERFGEPGNFIKSQIKEEAEELPTKTFLYLPSPAARDFKVSLNGVQSSTLSLGALSLSGATGTPVEFATQMGTVTGLTASGGTKRTILGTTDAMDASISASDNTLTIAKTGGTGDFGTDTQAGDVVVIPEGSAFAGASDENAGAYVVETWTASQIEIRQLKNYNSGGEAAAQSFDTSAVTGASENDIAAWSPVTLEVTQSAPTGSGATLELSGDAGDTFAHGNMLRASDLMENLDSDSAAVGTIEVTVPSGSPTRMSIKLTSASWTTVPRAGDLISIRRGSKIAGGSNENVGLHTVVSASADTIVTESVYGISTAAVSQTDLNGDTAPLYWAPGFVSSTLSAETIDSAAERQVYLEASKVTTGETFPTTRVGGNVALEISYTDATATAATVSIDQRRVMKIEPTGGSGSTVEVRLNKYQSLDHLVTFLNTQANISARVPNQQYRSLPTSVLDMVSNVGILGVHTSAAYNGRIKKDYYDWTQLFERNSGLIDFKPGTLVLKAGLPGAESSTGFLSGGAKGSSSDADFQKGLDQALKIDVRMVVPLISRDARYDLSDGLTEPGSTYSIDSVNAAVRNHVATATSIDWQSERFGYLSFHGSFEDAQQKAGSLGYERTQMAFQQIRATGADGSLRWFQPWMGMVALAAGRAQAPLGTSMLRKTFAINSVRHLGNKSLFSEDTTPDFEADDRNELSQAIESGLLVFRAVSGVGVRLESPDLSTRSRQNDPQGWVYERVNVLFTADEVRQTVRTTLDNFIGDRQTDTPLSVVRQAANDTIGVFIGGALLGGQVTSIKRVGVTYRAEVEITPAEALEAITLDVVAKRAEQAA